jgi:C-terminal processing protease CtpA/Prc
VVLVGQPTRGANRNPAPVELPLGIKVFYSRSVPALPDGTVVDGRGVQPDIVVEPVGSGDPTFEAALREVTARVGASRENPEPAPRAPPGS